MIAAVVPVKASGAAKSRLQPRLGADGTRRLTLAMLEDVLAALAEVEELERVAVVTPDPEVAAAARAVDAEALLRDDPGLNPALEAAAQLLAPNPEDGVLVVLGDVAGARSEDLSALLAAAPRPGVALAPALDGGTAALLRVPRDVIPAAFGPDSGKRHRELAAAAGVPCRELALPSLGLDLDYFEDVEAFLERGGGGPRTRRLLGELLGNPR